MLELDVYYARLLSASLKKCEERNGKFNFRCPYCGDSEKDKNKKRAWFYPKDNQLKFHCFNCGKSSNFNYFLNDPYNPERSPHLYDQYRLEKFSEKIHPSHKEDLSKKLNQKFDLPDLDGKSIFENFSKASSSPVALRYLKNRGFAPSHSLVKDLYFTDDFISFYNQYTDSPIKGYKSPRLVFPLIDQNQIELGAQSRAIQADKLRYMTTVLSEAYTPVYGLHRASLDQTVIVCEGGFDAACIPNAIAALNGDLSSKANLLNLKKDKTILIYDNEPASREIKKFMRKAIDEGWTLAFWKHAPSSVGKDINEALLKGNKWNDLFTFDKGLSAKLKMTKWQGKIL